MSSDDKNKFLESVRQDIVEGSSGKKEEIVSYFVIGIFVGVFVFCIILMGIHKTKENKLNFLTDQIQSEVTEPLASLTKEEKQSEAITAQLSALTLSLSQRSNISQLLSDLLKDQYKKSQWTDFNLQGDTLTISGKVDTYQEVAKVVSAIRELSAISQAEISSAVADQETGKIIFTLNAKYDQSLYAVAGAKQSVTTNEKPVETPESSQ